MGRKEVKRLRERVAAFAAERDAIQSILATEGPRLMKALCGEMSLRKAARYAKLSPTYLSQIKQGNVVASPGSYIALADVYEDHEIF